ncbi:BnaC02g33840D [Brassica napus]|uniref:BnaC02g33840D protein n=1 Tax=Brassica napus TaxID=3708 RepID=A0A078HHZ2_BRANA|nr:BnaC02g33840D [Brassica napus]
MSSSDVVAQSAFDVLRLGRSSQFIVARLLRFLTNGHQNLNRSSVAGSTRVCNPVQGKRVGHE